jgi:RNA polymerase sigma-70 factor (ECF subfamily)
VATTSAPDPFLAAGRLGDEAARSRVADLFARHGRTVEGLCRGLLRDRAEAEDAAQQTFLSAYRALIGGTEPREPAAWLAAIARNECLARIRARMREPLPVEELEAEETRADPLGEALRRADLAAFWAAVGELPKQQRDALLLREFGGLSYDELAVALGVSGPAIESLLFRARTRMRAQLKEAFASVGWISEALARVLSAGGAAKIGSVPVVAKVVTAGVGVAVVAGTAVVEERHAAPAHRTRPAIVAAAGSTVAPSKPRVVAAILPVAAVPAVRHVGPAAPARTVRSQGQDGEAGDLAAERNDHAARHGDHGGGRSHGAGDHSGGSDANESGRHASGVDEPGARSAVAVHGGESGDANHPQEPSDGSDQSGDSGSVDGSPPSDSAGSPPANGPSLPSVTRVTKLLPHDGRELTSGE